MKMRKKLTALLLAAVMLLPFALASCKDGTDESSAGSGETSSATSEESEQVDVFVDYEAMEAIDALYTGEVDRTQKKISLSKGKTYTLSRETTDPYKDPGTYLTDGVTMQSFDKENWAGFSGSGAVEITIDLGAELTNIAELDLGCLKLVDYAINSPARVVFSASSDGESFVTVGEVYTPTQISETVKLNYTAALQGTITARYVRASVYNPAGWLFLDEFAVYAFEGENTGEEDTEFTDDYYGTLDLEKPGSDEYWSSSESDYDSTVNLISGLLPQIEQVAEFDKVYAASFYNSTESNGALTDGKYSSAATYTNSAWFRFTSGEGRNVYFDLGKISAVSGIRASFLKEEGPNIRLPAGLIIYGSVDGENWKVIHSVDTIYADGESAIAKVEAAEGDFDKTYKARYIRISFTVVTHIYCDEIEILGKKNVSGAAELSEATEVTEMYPQEFIKPEDFMGVENMLLSYNCNPGDPANGLITVEEYLPHVGYYDYNNELKDTFFDSFLYLPYSSFNSSDNAKYLTGWKQYIDNVFTENRNISALDQAVGQVAGELGLDDYKVSVFFSILYPFNAITEFGDVDGDGVIEDFSKFEDRKKAIKWMVDEQLSRYLDGGYENLELLGFYWFEEQISYNNPNETELIKYAVDYVHSLGYKIFWIPYNYASGYSEWRSLGFDLACMQPNYAFRYNTTRDILYRTADTTKLLGMCVELEINVYDNPADVARYKEYLAVGAETGYMDAVKIYYQGGVPGAFYNAYKSTDKYVNSVYHDTYAFAKGKFSEETQTGIDEIKGCDDITLEVKGGTTVNGALEIDTEASYSVKLALSPKYGAIRLNGDGSFSYIARRGFDVVDTFYVYADYGYGISDPIKITINVHP